MESKDYKSLAVKEYERRQKRDADYAIEAIEKELRDADQLVEDKKRWANCSHENVETWNHGHDSQCKDCGYVLY